MSVQSTCFVTTLEHSCEFDTRIEGAMWRVSMHRAMSSGQLEDSVGLLSGLSQSQAGSCVDTIRGTWISMVAIVT